MTDRFDYLGKLPAVLARDNAYVQVKDRQYGSSWKKRGGVGAFMMLARKWDRLDEMLERNHNYDLFEGIRAAAMNNMQGQDGTILAEVRDLRRYLALVEAEMIEQGAVEISGLKQPADITMSEVYDLAAQTWGVERSFAKKRILELIYGEKPGTRFPDAREPAQMHLDIETAVPSSIEKLLSDLNEFLGHDGQSVSVAYTGGGSTTVVSTRPAAREPAQDHIEFTVPTDWRATDVKRMVDDINEHLGGGGGLGVTTYTLPERSELSPAADNGAAGVAVAAAGDEASQGLANAPEPRDPPNYELGAEEEEEEWKPETPPLHPSPVLDLEHQRQPRDATDAEFKSFANLLVPAGSMKDINWHHLYEESAAEDGRWKMFPIYHEEYGS